MPTQAASRAGCDLSRASPPGICRATSAGAVPSSAWVRTSRPSAACRLPIAPAQHENRTEPITRRAPPLPSRSDHDMNLNQVSVSVHDLTASVAFYQLLGLKLIVLNDHYARFELPQGEAT